MTKILGTHNTISLVQKDNGDQFYYSQSTGKTAIGIKGLARLLSTKDSTSQSNSLVNIVDKLGVTKQHEMYTEYGIKLVKLIVEDDLPKVLSAVAKSRMKKATKDQAIALQEKLAQAGFRLMVLMEVAPELVAKEAINRIESPEKAEQVASDAIFKHSYYAPI